MTGAFDDATKWAARVSTVEGWGSVAADVNLDGRIDIYVANDMCPKFLFLNRGETRVEHQQRLEGALRGGISAGERGGLRRT